MPIAQKRTLSRQAHDEYAKLRARIVLAVKHVIAESEYEATWSRWRGDDDDSKQVPVKRVLNPVVPEVSWGRQ
jgi:hypothetical protein